MALAVQMPAFLAPLSPYSSTPTHLPPISSTDPLTKAASLVTMSSPDEHRPCAFLRLTPDIPIEAQRPSSFLSLAPSMSDSYPRIQAHRASSISSDSDETAVEIPRHKSSVSGPRILKLGPVHWGEHLSEHKDDFHEVASPSPSP